MLLVPIAEDGELPLSGCLGCPTRVLEESVREFNFIKSYSFIVPTPYVAEDLKEFLECIEKVSVHSIYFHIFEARLRLEKVTNDFSYWMRTSLGMPELAVEIAALDPYTFTLEALREAIVQRVEKYILKTGE